MNWIGTMLAHLVTTKEDLQMNFNNDEKDVLFLSLNAIIKDYEVWNRLETKDKYHFLTSYKKIAENNNSQFNLRYKLNDILKEYDEEYIWDAVFLIKVVVEGSSYNG